MSTSDTVLRYKPVDSSQNWRELAMGDLVRVGRNPDCELVLTGGKVSRLHAEFRTEGSRVLVKDLNSSNGTYINGVKIQPGIDVVLQANDVVRIGDTEFVVNQPSVYVGPNPITSDLAGSMLWYRIEQGEWKQVPFDETVTIGRDKDCGLTVDEGHVSRVHCKIEVQDGNYSLIDLGSHNGTRLEGQTIPPNQPTRIYPGQYFSIGRVTMTIVSSSQQKRFQQTAEKSLLQVNPVVYHLPAAQKISPPATPVSLKAKSKPIWPWLLGIGLVLMMCICGSIVGVLVLINLRSQPVIFTEDIEPDLFTTEMAELDTDELLDDLDHELQEETPEPVTPDFTETPTAEPHPIPETKWLIILYENADDEILEYDIVFDVNTAEFIGSSEEVKIVTQLDRYIGSYDGDGDWTGARRYELSQGDNLDQITSPVLEDLGEVDSGDVQTLIDFVIWAIETYPAENIALILSDHGGGWFGGYTDSDNGNTDGIYLPALDSALGYITQRTGIEKFDLFGFDACLMAQLEVWSVIAPYADIGVASEETESATGWAYAAFLQRLVENPGMDARALAAAIVDTFVEDDLMYQIRDEDPGYAMSSSTLSAIDLNQLGGIHQALNELAYAMQSVDQAAVAEARSYSMSYVLFSDYEAFFLDLVNFGEMVCSYSGDASVCTASDTLSQAVSNAIFAEKHGSYMTGSNGITFYFPDSSFFEVTMDDSYGFAYRQHAGVFAGQSVWDEFLDFHYLGRSLP
ncbi:MAG: FHA domain-containing protein [Anaerolineae bacterium]|nr:FHA domain-containing protein [Anaerolineae bacterium]